MPSFFSADGGVYGPYNVTALASYLLGVAVQIQFVATDFYMGPLARALGGIDVSWVVGVSVVSPVHYFSVRLLARPQTMRTASLS